MPQLLIPFSEALFQFEYHLYILKQPFIFPKHIYEQEMSQLFIP